GDEGAAERDRAVVLDEAVPAEEDGEKAEPEGGAAAAVEVVDEPAEAGVLLHPGEEADDLGRAEVMGEKRADDDVGLRVGLVGEDVGVDPVDAGGEWVVGVERACGAGGVRVEVDAGEADGKVARGGPMRDGDQGVAAARADVQDPKRPRWGRVRDPKRPRWRGVRLDDAGGYAVSYTGSYTVKEGEGVA